MLCVSPGNGGAGGRGTGGAAGHGPGGTAGATAGTAGTAGHGSGGTAGAATGTGGATGGTAGAAAGATGNGGTGVGCVGSVPTETSFGYFGQGDSNPSFQSGVGALGTNVMYILSGYTSSAGDAGAGSQEIYAQAFDPKSGLKRGPSQPLFAPPTLGFESANYVGGTVYLFAASVASSGGDRPRVSAHQQDDLRRRSLRRES